MFTQLQVFRDRTAAGLGIGLTLARRLIELHDGSIEAQSRGPGCGTTFLVRLPLSRTGTVGTAAPKRRATPGAGGCRVLIADDSADTTEMMRTMLALKGYDVAVANDGVQAVEIAAAFRPQMAMLDIGMPRMDGYVAARKIRDLLGTSVVLVALTGWGQDDDLRRSREAGFDHHLTKPADPERLDQLLDSCGGMADRE